MKFISLIQKSKARLDPEIGKTDSFIGFDEGAYWMARQLRIPLEIDDKSRRHFQSVGILKYVSCLIFALCIIVIWGITDMSAYILGVLTFYLIEVHFLFLFPIMIERRSPILKNSIKATYKIGFIPAILNIIPLGMYMLLGLLRFKKPFYNWYVGCMAILIWYAEEIRD